jgi:acyl CoA:acetate/3-ketoacid CoA transferase
MHSKVNGQDRALVYFFEVPSDDWLPGMDPPWETQGQKQAKIAAKEDATPSIEGDDEEDSKDDVPLAAQKKKARKRPIVMELLKKKHTSPLGTGGWLNIGDNNVEETSHKNWKLVQS